MKRILNFLVNRLSALRLITLHRLGRAVGAIIWLAAPGRRRYAIQTISDRLELSQAEAKKIARASYLHNGCSFLELFHVPHFGAFRSDNNLELTQPELYKHLLYSPRPAVVVTAHLGAWELFAAMLGESSAWRPAQAVVRRQSNQTVNEIVSRLRGAAGGEVLDHRQAAPKVLAALRNAGVVGFLVDHNTRHKESIFLPFIGKVAAVNQGPALLALRARAVIFPVFLIRSFGQNGGPPSYSLKMEEPLDTAELKGPLKEQVRQVAEYYTRAVEKNVRQYPEQWFWMHRRWKTRPPEDTLPDLSNTQVNGAPENKN